MKAALEFVIAGRLLQEIVERGRVIVDRRQVQPDDALLGVEAILRSQLEARAVPSGSTTTRCSRVAGNVSVIVWRARPLPPFNSDALRPASDSR